MTKQTGAEVLVAQMAARGVRRIYGVPGGDCSLDVIAAADKAGIDFILTRTESSAALMACAEAEITGTLGVVLTTRGPGISNAANGIAYASLDRAPLLLIGDAYENHLAFVSHQRFDQEAMLSPVIKGALRLDEPTALPGIGALLDLAAAGQPGPVYIELTGASMRGTVPAGSIPVHPSAPSAAAASPDAMTAASRLLAQAQRPIIVAGLQARDGAATEGLRALAARLGCPVLATYKAKGVLSDEDPLMTGSYIGGAAEENLMRSADLVVMYGADPVEFPPQPWKYDTPVLEFTTVPFARHYFTPALTVVGDLGSAAKHLAKSLQASHWAAAEIAEAKQHMRSRAAAMDGGPISPQLLVERTCAAMPAGSRVTVDAGVHMLAVVAFFEARQPRDMMISRGLATMGFALPAAIGAAIADPSRHVVAFTGDGGLMMCTAELATAVQQGCRLTVVVFNDSAITMIGLKQRSRKLSSLGMDYSDTDFAAVARGFGCAGFRAENPTELDASLKAAFAGGGTSVVDAVVDPTAYQAQLRSLRG